MMINIQAAFAYTEAEIYRDSKPKNLSLSDQLYLRADVIRFGMMRTDVLVNRVTNRVSYVWYYKRYVRPKYSMPNAQVLYDRNNR